MHRLTAQVRHHIDRWSRSAIARYIAAFLIVALATLLSLAVPEIHNGAPFVFLFPAVVFAALFGGLGPGLLATALVIMAALLWVHPDDDYIRLAPWEPIQLVSFAVVAGAVVALIQELRATRTRLDSERESLRITLAAITDGVIATDTAGRITWLNEVAALLTGWTPSAVIGAPIEMVYQTTNPTTGALLANPVRTVLADPKVLEPPAAVRLREALVDASVAPIFDRSGALAGAVLVFRDVTQRRRAELALQASEERFRIAQELSLDAFTILEAIRDDAGAIVDFRWTYANPAAGRILQHAPEAMVGQRLLQLLPGNRANSELFARYVAIVQSGEPHDLEVAYDADNIQGWFRNMAVKLGDGVAVSFTEISDRKRYEQQLGYQAFLLDNVSDAVFAIDGDNRITLWNRGAAALYGWSAEEVLGRPSPEVVQSASTPEERSARLAAVAAGRKRNYDAVHRHRDGSLLYIDSVATALRNPEGHIIGYVIINRDAGERVRHEQELVALNASLEQRILDRTDELERSNRDLDQFAYVASHDLKAPLRAIAALAGWIVEDASPVLPEPSRQHLDKLVGRVRRMEVLLDDLLTYSRAGRLRHEPELVDTEALVREIGEFLNLPSTFKVLTDALPTLNTERVPLATVLRNLIQNAYKHHDDPAHGCVVVAAQPIADGTKFTVADDGPGIDPDYHARIFEIFQKLERRDEVEGSGIGLTVVKKIIESRGGTLGLDSALGEGSAFWFVWPAK